MMKWERKPIEDVYPDCFKSRWDGPCDYDPLVESFGDVLVKEDDHAYSGDSRVLLSRDGRLGHLTFGWGSCSGCDALYGASSYANLDELRDDMERCIVWFDDAEHAAQWFSDHDWAGDYCEDKKALASFIEKATKAIAALV